MKSARLVFITGTDTGVGKTLLTALLLHSMRSNGVKALATKPFCSGGTRDVKLLQSLQKGELTDGEMNPYYFAKPVAPLVEARETGRKIRLKQVSGNIRKLAKKCDVLLIEGSGGLMVPLGKGFDVGDLIADLGCEVILVSRNKLGTINHTLLTIKALKTLGVLSGRITVVMMAGGVKDASCATNCDLIQEMGGVKSVFEMPFLGKRAGAKREIEKKSWEIAELLVRIGGNRAVL